jgi:2-oxoglutarate-dependent dioxygenase
MWSGSSIVFIVIGCDSYDNLMLDTIEKGIYPMSATASQPLINALNLTDSEVAFYKNEGYLCLPGLICTQVVEAIRDEIFEVLDANGVSREALSQATSHADKLRQCSQYLAGSLLDDLINGSAVKAVVSRLLEGSAHVYLPFTAVKSAGGGGMFHFHQDNNYTQHEPAVGSINIWVALVDMMPENGCLQVVPRSHQNGQLISRNSDDGDSHQQLDVDPMQCLPIRMRAGDAIAFTRWTVHGSGPNMTKLPRVAYALQFYRDEVKWLDPSCGQWKLLIDNPRFATPPVEKLGSVK